MGSIKEKYLNEIYDKYKESRPLSYKFYLEASKVMPGGDTRTATYFKPYPHFISKGHGAYMTDVDGNMLLDFQNNYTSLIHGHGHKETVEAVKNQIEIGSAFTSPLKLQTELAGIITDRFPGIDLVRFTNSGTEANMHVLRIARAFTGNAKVVKTEGGYHGTTDVFEASVDPNIKKAGSLSNIKIIPESRGVSKNALKDVLVTPFNDVERTEKVLRDNYEDIACIIIEPIMGSAGQITPTPKYLDFLKRITKELNILLVFDEVVTGRLACGGAQEFYGITPDLTSLGKIIGGGMPIGAFGGRREIMEMYDPRQKKMYHSGTFNGNAISMAAGIATLKSYNQNAVNYVNSLGKLFKEGVLNIYSKLGLNMQISGEGSIYNILFTNKPVYNYRHVASSHEDLNKILFISLLTKGVFNAERGMFCMSTAMDKNDVNFGLWKIKDALAEMLPLINKEAPELLK